MAFENFDINHDGKLSVNEIKDLLQTSDENYIEDLFQETDKNKDGFLSYVEFKDLMKLILKDDKSNSYEDDNFDVNTVA